MLSQLVYLFLSSLIAPGATQEFPVKFQVDLIFPKNETYAPTSYFPVVYAVHSFRAAEHLDLYLHGTIKTDKSRRYLLDESIPGRDYDSWTFPEGYVNFGGYWGESRDADPMFIVTSTTPITNGNDFSLQQQKKLSHRTTRAYKTDHIHIGI